MIDTVALVVIALALLGLFVAARCHVRRRWLVEIYWLERDWSALAQAHADARAEWVKAVSRGDDYSTEVAHKVEEEAERRLLNALERFAYTLLEGTSSLESWREEYHDTLNAYFADACVGTTLHNAANSESTYWFRNLVRLKKAFDALEAKHGRRPLP